MWVGKKAETGFFGYKVKDGALLIFFTLNIGNDTE